MTCWHDLGINCLAQFLFWLFAGILVLLYTRLTNVRRFRQFFGLYKDSNIVIYLSNMKLKGASDLQIDPKDRGVSLEELRAVQSIYSLFGRTPLRVPELVRGLVDGYFIPGPTKVATEPSPITADDLRFTNMIVIGSARHNSVREHYLTQSTLPYLALEPKESDYIAQGASSRRGVRVLQGNRKGDLVEENYNFAIVEKICGGDKGTVVFMCVGERGDSSWGAAEYLVRNWGRLSKRKCKSKSGRFGTSSFALCLGFPKRDMQVYEEPVILAEFPTPASE